MDFPAGALRFQRLPHRGAAGRAAGGRGRAESHRLGLGWQETWGDSDAGGSRRMCGAMKRRSTKRN